MLTSYDSFVIQETLSEYFPLNENTIPGEIQDVAKNVADKVDTNVAEKVEQEYGNKSLKQIIQHVYKVIKDSGVVGDTAEFAKDIASGAIASVVKWIAKKVGEYSTIGLILVSIVDKVIPDFGLLDSWFTRIEWKLGIAIFVSLVIYILARRLKRRRK